MIVKAENVVKRYKELIALDHFNMEVYEGEILGLLGPNGCGKTTAINCILSLLKIDKGNIQVLGSHNSYKQAIEPALLALIQQTTSKPFEELQYSHQSITEQ